MKWLEYFMGLLFLSMMAIAVFMFCRMGVFYAIVLPLGGIALLIALLILKERRKDDNT